MNLTDDPRLTAYALDEMTAVERVGFERELANDPAAQAEVEAIRATAGVLSTGLHDELTTITATRGGTPVDALSLAPVPADADLSPVTLPRTIRHLLPLAAAAAVVVAGVVAASLMTAQHQERVAISAGDVSSSGHDRLANFNVHAEMPRASVVPVTHGGGSGGGVTPARDTSPRPIRPQGFDPAAGDPRGFVRTPGLSTAAGAQQQGQSLLNGQPTNSTGVDAQNHSGEDASGRGLAERMTQLKPSGSAVASAAPAQLFAGDRAYTSVRQSPGRADDSVLNADGDSVANAGLLPKRSTATLNTRVSELMRRRVPEAEPFDFRANPHQVGGQGNESYAPIQDNAFLNPTAAPLSTFGVDVDTASFANVRRYLSSGQLPPADAVRIEELINYFPTADAPPPPATSPTGDVPFAVHTEVGDCPWAPEHRLVRIALKGKVIDNEKRPPSNLVFLIDVSGSMDEPNKLPLVQRSLRKLVGQLGENDRVAIVVYAGNSGMVLPSTNASEKTKILDAIDNLKAGGSTNGGEGIELAYKTAEGSFVKNGTNRVILCTDGDFNVGVTDRSALFDLIASKAKDGVFLSVCGFGTGNTKDDTMEGLADKGNGQYAYIDTDREADKVFVGQIGGTLVTIAKDVKLQLEFNPATVKSYRLIGYENRVMAAQDFNNDLKDSGDIGAGHNVVALYEIDPTTTRPGHFSDPEQSLKYQHAATAPIDTDTAHSNELLTLKLRFKKPDAPLEQGTSELIETVVHDQPVAVEHESTDFRFDASVAAFGMLLRDSPYKGSASWDLIRSLARSGIGTDAGGYRSEFLNMIDQAAQLRR